MVEHRMTKEDRNIEVRDFRVGDVVEVVDLRLIVVGVASATETPESASTGPLYEVEKGGIGGTKPGGERSTMLYRPHHLVHVFDAGGEIGEPVDVDEPTEPFWCEACEMPTRGGDRRDAWLIDAAVCSYGCREKVALEEARERADLRLSTKNTRGKEN